MNCFQANSQIDLQRFENNLMSNSYLYNSRNWISYMQNSEGIFDYNNEYDANGNVHYQNFNGSYVNNFADPSDYMDFN